MSFVILLPLMACNSPTQPEPSSGPQLSGAERETKAGARERRESKGLPGSDPGDSSRKDEGQIYTIVMRRTATNPEQQWAEPGVLVVKSVPPSAGTPATEFPSTVTTETYCYRDAPVGFSWPRIISTPNVTSDSWLILPKTDSAPNGRIDCASGRPERLDDAVMKTFQLTPCDGTKATTDAADDCPVAKERGLHADQASPVIGLSPGTYHAASRYQDASGSVVQGNGVQFVRVTEDPLRPFVVTWCYDTTFHLPAVHQGVGGTEVNRTWWEYSTDVVTAAPIEVICTPTGRADFWYAEIP